jgi:signal peptidase I
MKRLLSGICASALAAAVALTGILPAQAGPTFVPKMAQASSDVQTVQDGPRWKKRKYNRHSKHGWDGPRHSDHGPRHFVRRGDNYYFNGHRGYKHYRHGYREYNGWWFPAGAFIAGALITGAMNNDNYYRGTGGNAHVRWCYNRYRSYRAWDNTFQPYNGPRRQCYSPYS